MKQLTTKSQNQSTTVIDKTILILWSYPYISTHEATKAQVTYPKSWINRFCSCVCVRMTSSKLVCGEIATLLTIKLWFCGYVGMASNCGVEYMKQCMMESWLGRRRLVLLMMLLMVTVIGVVVQPTAADHVWIQNQMGETLEVHCMSGDDDLGWQILANGQIYGFRNTYKWIPWMPIEAHQSKLKTISLH